MQTLTAVLPVRMGTDRNAGFTAFFFAVFFEPLSVVLILVPPVTVSSHK